MYILLYGGFYKNLCSTYIDDVKVGPVLDVVFGSCVSP